MVSLSADDLDQLVRWEAAQGTPQQVALRCRLILAAAAGKQDLEIAAAYDVNRHTARCGDNACAPRASRQFGKSKPVGGASRS